MYTRDKLRRLFDNDAAPAADLRHMYRIDLTDEDIEFLSIKRGIKTQKNYAPDPMLGDYEA